MRRRAAVPAASVLHIRANDQKNDQQHDGDGRVRADGGGKQPAEEEGKIAVAGIITVTVIVAAVISSAVISSSAVAVVVEVAHVRVRAHRADGRKDERAQHQRCEENTNRFFHHSDRCLPRVGERLPFLRNAGKSPGSYYNNLRGCKRRASRRAAGCCGSYDAIGTLGARPQTPSLRNFSCFG